MTKIEPIQTQPILSDVIKGTPVNGEVQIHADRIASFKSTVNRVNSQAPKGTGYLFTYSGVKNDYCVATRIS